MNSIRVSGARVAVASIGLLVALFVHYGAQGSAASQDTAGAEASIVRAGLVGDVEAALGSAFAGVWFEPSTAQLHVGTVSPASRRLVEAVAGRVGLASSVTESRVRSTWNQLIAAQQRLSGRLADLFASAEAATALRPELNSVEVELGSAVSPARRASLERAARATGVDVLFTTAPGPHIGIHRDARCNKFEEDKAYCDPTIVAGVRIEAKKVCTGGPAVMPQDHTKPTDTYILTAGHCIDEEEGGGGVGEKWFAFNKKGEKKEVGKAVEFLNGEAADVGVIKVDNPGYWAKEGFTPVDPAIAAWNEEEPEPKAVKGQEAPAVGTKVCMSGQSTGTSCGKILKLNVEAAGTAGLVEVEATRAGGDSGAPWYLESAVGTVEGTHVGFKGENAVFEPIATSFEKLTTKLKLLTETNKVRHAFKFEAEAVPATLTGKLHAGKALILTTAGGLECNEASFTGSQAAKEVVEIELSPTYAGCTFLGMPATVDVNGCKYRFTVTKIEAGKREGSMDIVCGGANEITITATMGGVTKCTIHIPPQNDLRPVTYTNIGTGATREITIDVNVGALKYTHTAGTGAGACTSGSAENGVLAGAISITAEKAGGEHVGFFTS
jgi:hypothetical protein